MNKADGIGFAQRPATVDHLLGTPLDLGVTALYRSEVEIGTGGARRHRRSRPATQANQHGRTTQHNQLATDRNFALLDMVFADVAVTPRQHDRFVVAAPLDAVGTQGVLLIGT